MTFLPIVGRELRVAARRNRTYWTRLGLALLGVGAATWIYVAFENSVPREMGMMLFAALSILINLYALLVGVHATADCLSQEKREGTLGLLFLTDLKGYDIVLGKLAATSLDAFYAMLAVFPVLGGCLLLGGVAPAEFWRVVLVSVNNLFFSLAAGMGCSALSREERTASSFTFLVVVVLAALPVLGAMFAEVRGTGQPHPIFLLPSPAYTVFLAFEAPRRSGAGGEEFYISMMVVQSMTWGLLLLSCWLVPRVWQESAPGGGRARARLRERWRQWCYGDGEMRRAWRRELCGVNPIWWLCCRERRKMAAPWVVLAVLSGLWLAGYLRWPREWLEAGSIPCGLIGHTLLKVWLTGESTRRFSEDRHSGAMELLLATPIRVADFVDGQRRALWRQFAGPAGAVLLADLALMGAGGKYITPADDKTAWIFFWMATMTMLVWDLFTLSWVGMWMGVNSRSPGRAANAALARVCVLPWVLFGGWMTLLMLSRMGGRSGSDIGPGFVICCWFLIGAVNNILLGLWARNSLLTQFREVATRSFETKPPSAWESLVRELRGGR